MDVVYVYAHTNSEELEWSVKSVRKNLEHRNIYIVGDDPIIEGTIHIPTILQGWMNVSKYHNQIAKYLTAAHLPELSDDFIAMNDDFFIMDKWEPVNNNRGVLEDHLINRHRIDQYQRSLSATIKYLINRQLPTLDYEMHTPMIFNKHKLLETIASLQIRGSEFLQLRSLYGNINGIESTYKKDVKNPFKFKDEVILSTSNVTFKKEIGDYIREKLS